MNGKKIKIHPHLEARMRERGVSIEEIEKTLQEGWEAENVKSGTYGKVYVFSYNKKWCGKFFKEKEVTVYYKIIDREVIVLTVVARYGKFKKGVRKDEI